MQVVIYLCVIFHGSGVDSISREDGYICKFYDSMDTWYHWNEAESKHISMSSSDNVNTRCDFFFFFLFFFF